MSTVRTCPIDGTEVDPDASYAGKPHGGDRRVYCTPACRREAERRKRAEARTSGRQLTVDEAIRDTPERSDA